MIKEIDRWINDKVSDIKWYNKMLIILIAFFIGRGIRTIVGWLI